MTKDTQAMPEEIWAYPDSADKKYGSYNPEKIGPEVKYIRADLVTPAPSQDREKALADFEKMMFHFGSYWNAETARVIRAALQSPRPRDDLPAGYVLVPVEPCLETLGIGANALDPKMEKADAIPIIYKIWKAMIAAAPKADGGA